jgi:short subunit dehydrogenase-like uncharacterized protein
MGELKRARLAEGPTDQGVMRLSERVEAANEERDRQKLLDSEDYFDPAKVLGTDEIMERIQKAIKEDNQALKEAFE